MRERLEQRFGLQVLTPPADARERLKHVVLEEMARGQFLPTAMNYAVGLVEDLVTRGAQAVVLGCTELPILLRGAALPCPALDTTRLHALAAADFSLEGAL